MRLIALALVIMLFIGIIVPPTLSLVIADRGTEAIGLLDVCHKAAPSLSSNGDMPCAHACPGTPVPFPVVASSEHIPPLFTHFLLSARTEQPPRS